MSENEVKTTLTDEWGSFTAIPNEFIHMAGELQEQSRWLFVLLRHYTNSETKTAFPSYAEIKHKTGWAFNTIAKAIRDLEEHGWLIRKKQFSGNTHYTLIRKSKSVKSLPEASNDQSLPEASNDQSLRAASTSEPQVQSLRAARPVLASRKPIKTEITKTKINKTESVAATAARTQDPLSIHREVFGEIPIYQQELILNADIQQLTAWRKVCQDWKDNRYSTRNVTGLIDSYYRAEVQTKKDKDRQNGTSNYPIRESNGERAARESLELIAALTGTGRGTDNADSENKVAGFLAGAQW